VQSDSSQTPEVQNQPPAQNAVFASIPVTVQVMLGTATLQLAELMNISPNAEIMLDQALGQAVTVIVNGTKIAKGELYVLEDSGDRLGVRITELLSQTSP
jgi:flagellar motor switch protein FliN